MKAKRYLTAFVILSAAGLAAAQVVPTQRGRALDANYLVGSGGVNSIRSASRSFNANLYVTGQVAGGFHFRGIQPYAGANQLRIDSPSAGMDDFIRGSVGVPQVTAGRYYGPTGYMSATRTVVSPSDIARGLNAPGASIPRATYLPAASAHRLYDEAMKAYEPAFPDMASRPLWANPLVQPGLVDQPVQGAGLTMPVDFDRGAIRPAASTLFGILREPDQKRLIAELAGAKMAYQDRKIDLRMDSPAYRDSKIDARMDARVKPSAAGTEPPKIDQAEPAQPTPATDKMPRPGQDVFVDLLVLLKQMSREQDQPDRPGHPESPADPDRPGPGAEADRPGPSGPDSERGQAPHTPAVQRMQKRIVIRRLAGQNQDQFNIRMSRAEKLLSEGKYYEAAGYYKVAVIYNRANSLASLGEALALFGADEPLTGAYHLRQAMRKFSPLMDIRVDVNAILGKQVVKLRIGQIEHRLIESGDNPDPSQVFLAAFIRSSMDQPDKAAAHAATLKKIAGADKIHRAYAERLLKRPHEKKTPADKDPSTPNSK